MSSRPPTPTTSEERTYFLSDVRQGYLFSLLEETERPLIDIIKDYLKRFWLPHRIVAAAYLGDLVEVYTDWPPAQRLIALAIIHLSYPADGGENPHLPLLLNVACDDKKRDAERRFLQLLMTSAYEDTNEVLKQRVEDYLDGSVLAVVDLLPKEELRQRYFNRRMQHPGSQVKAVSTDGDAEEESAANVGNMSGKGKGKELNEGFGKNMPPRPPTPTRSLDEGQKYLASLLDEESRPLIDVVNDYLKRFQLENPLGATDNIRYFLHQGKYLNLTQRLIAFAILYLTDPAHQEENQQLPLLLDAACDETSDIFERRFIQYLLTCAIEDTKNVLKRSAEEICYGSILASMELLPREQLQKQYLSSRHKSNPRMSSPGSQLKSVSKDGDSNLVDSLQNELLGRTAAADVGTSANDNVADRANHFNEDEELDEALERLKQLCIVHGINYKSKLRDFGTDGPNKEVVTRNIGILEESAEKNFNLLKVATKELIKEWGTPIHKCRKWLTSTVLAIHESASAGDINGYNYLSTAAVTKVEKELSSLKLERSAKMKAKYLAHEKRLMMLLTTTHLHCADIGFEPFHPDEVNVDPDDYTREKKELKKMIKEVKNLIQKRIPLVLRVEILKRYAEKDALETVEFMYGKAGEAAQELAGPVRYDGEPIEELLRTLLEKSKKLAAKKLKDDAVIRDRLRPRKASADMEPVKESRST